MARKNTSKPDMRGPIKPYVPEGPIGCGCIYPASTATLKGGDAGIKYCAKHRMKYPLATGVVKTIEGKKQLRKKLKERGLKVG